MWVTLCMRQHMVFVVMIWTWPYDYMWVTLCMWQHMVFVVLVWTWPHDSMKDQQLLIGDEHGNCSYGVWDNDHHGHLSCPEQLEGVIGWVESSPNCKLFMLLNSDITEVKMQR